MTDKLYELGSACCGSTVDDNGFCGSCGEHSGLVPFEDADGNPAPMVVDRAGILRDVRFTPTWGEIAVVLMLVVMFIVLGAVSYTEAR